MKSIILLLLFSSVLSLAETQSKEISEGFGYSFMEGGLIASPVYKDLRILAYSGFENYKIQKGYYQEEQNFKEAIKGLCEAFGFDRMVGYNLNHVNKEIKTARMIEYSHSNSWSAYSAEASPYTDTKYGSWAPTKSNPSRDDYVIDTHSVTYFVGIVSWIKCR